MRKIFILAMLLSSGAMAADWKPISWTDEFYVSVDTSSIALVGKYRKAWVMWSYAKTQKTPDYKATPFMSVKTAEYYNCDADQNETVQQVLYDGAGGTGSSVDSWAIVFNPVAMRDVIPDSVGQTLLKAVCKASLGKR